MKKSDLICAIVLLITAILTVLSAVFLPDVVRIQRSGYTGYATDVPKAWGILLAALLSVSGAVGAFLSKKPESQKCGILVLSVGGYMVFAYMFVASWLI